MIRYILFLPLVQLVQAMGMLYSPTSLLEAQRSFGPSIRGADSLSVDPNSVYGPLLNQTVCRGAKKGLITPVSLNQNFSVTLAVTFGAEYLGNCTLSILDPEDMDNPTIIAESINSRACAYNRGPCQEVQRTGVLSEFCFIEWKINLENADKIKCRDCILEWKWSAFRGSERIEYENCADIILDTTTNDRTSFRKDRKMMRAQRKVLRKSIKNA